MNEKFLHFIWEMKLLSTLSLRGENNETIEIISFGDLNSNSGPDFLNAKIRVNEQLWVGNVEIHLNSSDWYAHKHEVDYNYDAVILHVVWNYDIVVFRKGNTTLPTLCLSKYVSNSQLKKYQNLFKTRTQWINCENQILEVDKFKLLNWQERLYFERLEEKAILVSNLLKLSNNNWEAVLFTLLLKNFGLKVNNEAFFNIAKSVDFNIIRKTFHNPIQFEALLFGQSNLLNSNLDSTYFKELKKEYKYLKSKFKLEPIIGNQIQFFRLRPVNFPTIRISQFAQLYCKKQNLFTKLMELNDLESIYQLFEIQTSEFWETHFTFEKESKKKVKKLTKPFIDLVLINTIIPIKFLYVKSLGKESFNDVLDLIQSIKPERNSIISKFEDLKIKSESAFDTQSLLQLKNKYCEYQHCLKCEIGISILKD